MKLYYNSIYEIPPNPPPPPPPRPHLYQSVVPLLLEELYDLSINELSENTGPCFLFSLVLWVKHLGLVYTSNNKKILTLRLLNCSHNMHLD